MNSSHLLRVCVVGAVLALGGTIRAEPPPVQQAYFEATVFKNQKIVSKPHALVRVGADAKMSFGVEDAAAPRLGLAYRVEQQSATALTANIKASVGGVEVATGTVSFTKDQAASATLDGGGYSWHVTVEYMTADLLKRRAGKKS